jgi:prepilin-type N-terminal cleavage/methylation domain-containing protein
MRSQRGLTLIELLVAMLASAVILLGVWFAYVAMARTFAQSSSQAALQRQGTLALAEIGQRVRSGVGVNGAAAVKTGSCRGHANSIQVVVPAGTVCYYAGNSGQLWQANSTAGDECTDTTCWNLLSEKLQSRPPGWTGITLLKQPDTGDDDGGGDPRCPLGADGNPLPAGARCFVMNNLDPSGTPSPSQVTVAFTITDGIAVMPFTITLSCSSRNC